MMWKLHHYFCHYIGLQFICLCVHTECLNDAIDCKIKNNSKSSGSMTFCCVECCALPRPRLQFRFISPHPVTHSEIIQPQTQVKTQKCVKVVCSNASLPVTTQVNLTLHFSETAFDFNVFSKDGCMSSVSCAITLHKVLLWGKERLGFFSCII